MRNKKSSALFGNDIGMAEQALKNGANIECISTDNINHESMTPLQTACVKGNAEMVRLLLRYGADIHCILEYGDMTPLHMASENGNVDIVRMLISAGASISEECAFGTPLHVACQNSHPDAAIYLIEHGANMWQEDPDGFTPLKLACIHNNQSLVRYMAALMKPWELSDVLYFLCAKYNQYNSVKTLIEAGANVVDKQHHTTTLHYAAVCHKNNMKTIQVILDAGLSVDFAALGGDTPLHTACKENSPHAIQNLILCGADINARNKAGETPIFELVKSGRAKLETLGFMKEHGADLAVTTRSGRTISDMLSYNPNKKKVMEIQNWISGPQRSN